MTKLKEFRLMQNLTQEEASKLIGITRSQIYRYEQNKQLPKVNTIYKMAEAYKVTPEEILMSLPKI
jgi:transcriptional regulator with XRE-family HTH domain